MITIFFLLSIRVHISLQHEVTLPDAVVTFFFALLLVTFPNNSQKKNENRNNNTEYKIEWNKKERNMDAILLYIWTYEFIGFLICAVHAHAAAMCTKKKQSLYVVRTFMCIEYYYFVDSRMILLLCMVLGMVYLSIYI